MLDDSYVKYAHPQLIATDAQELNLIDSTTGHMIDICSIDER